MSGGVDATTGSDVGAASDAFITRLWLPRLSELRRGEWSLRLLPATAARGYWGRLYRIRAMTMLTGPLGRNGAAWMSMVPMEIESQEIGIAAAHGHTVVMGLGLGWCAANAALNPAVERVTVVERDRDVMRLVEALGVFGQLPVAARAKIRLIEGDALRWRPDDRVDSLQADIWAKFVEPRKWQEVRRMSDNVGPASIYFWGQEQELWRLACRARGRVPERLEQGELAALVATTGLPLVSDERSDYPKRIVEAARWWAPREDGWWDQRERRA